MLSILTLLGIAFGAGAWVMCRELCHAPEGFEDHEGFHQTNPGQNRETSQAVEPIGLPTA
jgi:hypothetical protein